MDEHKAEDLNISQAARLAGRFIHLASQFDTTKPYRVEDHTELREIMDRFCREEQCRRIESRIHNLQSVYDSQIAGGAEEGKHPAIRQLRGAASIALHLFETATALSHLYGRHKMDSFLDGDGKVILSEITIGKLVINTCSVCAYKVLKETAVVADELLKELTEVESKTLEIPEGVNLHARPISLIVTVVNQHRTPVEAEIEGDKCSAASIMQLLVMAGGHPKVRAIRFTGDRRSLRDLELLFAARLGEDGFDKIPKELSYLIPSSG
jgi:phosphotransferase system HPr-like phosphotransfer protein